MAARKQPQRLTWCDTHQQARVDRPDGRTRCLACYAEQQAAYRKARLQTPEGREAARRKYARQNGWVSAWRSWQRFTRLPIELQRDLVRRVRTVDDAAAELGHGPVEPVDSNELASWQDES